MKITYSAPPQTIAASDLQPGDVWTSDKDDVTVDDVAVGFDNLIFYGTITRGYGRGTKSSWKVPVAQQLDVIRR